MHTLALVMVLLAAGIIGLGCATQAPAPSHTPVPTTTPAPSINIEATVVFRVKAASPTIIPTSTPTPDINATVEARLQATIDATATVAPSTPTPTPTPTPTSVPPPPTPTHTPVPPTPYPLLMGDQVPPLTSAGTLTNELRYRAEEWARHISSNDWVAANSRFSPNLMATCGGEDLEEYQSLFLSGEEPTWTVEIADIELDGNIGDVYFNLTSRGEHFQVREIPTPNKWIFENGEWWYAPDEPDERCVRYSPGSASPGLDVSQDEFLTRIASDASDIYGKLATPPCNQPLLDFRPYSEEMEPLGTIHSSLIQQRLPRMQMVTTYRVPGALSRSVQQPKIELILTGESHALNRIYLGGFEDYLESDPCIGTRILPYFIALGKFLAPEWDQKFSMLNWFNGTNGTLRALYNQSGDEIPEDQIQEYEGIKIFVRYEYPCNPVGDPFCPTSHSRWGMTFSTNMIGLESNLPPPTCESNPTLHYIETGETCP